MHVLHGWVLGLVCVLIWHASIVKFSPKSSVFLRFIYGYCRAGSHVQCDFSLACGYGKDYIYIYIIFINLACIYCQLSFHA